MKLRANPFFKLRTVSSALLLALAALPSAYAVDGTWAVNADGFWNTASNWSTSTNTVGNTVGDTVGLTINLSSTGKIVTIDRAVTLGTLNIGDTDNSNTYTLSLGTGGSLTFDQTGTSTANLNEMIKIILLILQKQPT